MVPTDSILQLAEHLVRTPSRAGVDRYEPVFTVVSEWLRQRAVEFTLLRAHAEPVALVIEIGPPKAPIVLFNATLDTAPFGDLSRWSARPTNPIIVDGWLHGRGSADSKTGAAIFCHVAEALWRSNVQNQVRVVVALDADEHTGNFAGIRAVLDHLKGPIVGGAIGYPGLDRILVGARGVFRARLLVSGEAAHSGSSSSHGTNAIVKASEYVRMLGERTLPGALEGFSQGPRITVTGVRGGGDFSLIPDQCEVDVDARLTPSFQAADFERILASVGDEVDAMFPSSPKSRFEPLLNWPPYRIENNAFLRCLSSTAESVLNRRLSFATAGPSNVGNLLAQRGPLLTCGFGVNARNIHAANECCEIASISPVYETYLQTARRCLTLGIDHVDG